MHLRCVYVVFTKPIFIVGVASWFLVGLCSASEPPARSGRRGVLKGFLGAAAAPAVVPPLAPVPTALALPGFEGMSAEQLQEYIQEVVRARMEGLARVLTEKSDLRSVTDFVATVRSRSGVRGALGAQVKEGDLPDLEPWHADIFSDWLKHDPAARMHEPAIQRLNQWILEVNGWGSDAEIIPKAREEELKQDLKQVLQAIQLEPWSQMSWLKVFGARVERVEREVTGSTGISYRGATEITRMLLGQASVHFSPFLGDRTRAILTYFEENPWHLAEPALSSYLERLKVFAPHLAARLDRVYNNDRTWLEQDYLMAKKDQGGREFDNREGVVEPEQVHETVYIEVARFFGVEVMRVGSEQLNLGHRNLYFARRTRRFEDSYSEFLEPENQHQFGDREHLRELRQKYSALLERLNHLSAHIESLPPMWRERFSVAFARLRRQAEQDVLTLPQRLAADRAALLAVKSQTRLLGKVLGIPVGTSGGWDRLSEDELSLVARTLAASGGPWPSFSSPDWASIGTRGQPLQAGSPEPLLQEWVLELAGEPQFAGQLAPKTAVRSVVGPESCSGLFLVEAL